MYNTKLHFHFVGIGGSGMSGLAEILLSNGFSVSGSDLKPSATCERLKKLGAAIGYGHKEENLPTQASLLVFSSAVRADNPELLAAQERGLPLVRRAEILAELMRMKYSVGVAGSHGKTTTTSLIATVMEQAGLDPTVIIGGQVKSLGSGGKLGKSDFLVAETDESDRSFLLLKPTIAVITNIDNEHLVAYKSLADLEASFEQFLQAVPFYGLAVLCIDDPKVKDLALRYRGRKFTYGLALDAQLRAAAIEPRQNRTEFEVWRGPEKLMNIALPMLGRHMVVNALAAVAIGLEFDIAPITIKEALEGFGGVGRRLELIGETQGISVISDYGHHPAEIKATIGALREAWPSRPIHVIFQPHRYSRTRDCFVDFLDAFKECDYLIVTDIYAAGEDEIVGVSGEKLCEAIVHSNKQFISSMLDVPSALRKTVNPGEIVLCLGAGTIGGLAEKALEALSEDQARVANVS